MKIVRIVIALPIDDEATMDDAEALANLIERRALTQRPGLGSPVRAYGRVVEVTLK